MKEYITPPVQAPPTVEFWLRPPEEDPKDPAYQTEYPHAALPDDHTRAGGNNYKGGRG